MKQSDDKGTLEKLGFSLERVIYPLSRWTSSVSMIAALIMMFLVTADVFMRHVFNQPIFGSYEVGQFLLTIVIFCAVGFVMATKGHVVVDTLTRLYPKILRSVTYSIAYFLSMIIEALISWYSAVYGLDMLRIGNTSMLLGIPVYPFIFLAAFGSAVLFFVILVQFIYAIAGVDEEAPPVGFW